MGDLDFVDLISSHDLVFLCETWIKPNESTNLNIPGYEAEHIFARKFSKTERGRWSGGISLYIRSNVKHRVKIVKKSDDGFLLIKVDKSVLKCNEDVYLCQVYFPDQNSKARKNDDVDHFDILEQLVIEYKTLGKMFIFGDFNCRCGNDSADILEFDRYLDEEDDSLSVDAFLRSSADHVIDPRGRRLIQFCQMSGLCLANGRLERGDFTYASFQGQSVVDYLLLSFDDREHVRNFTVSPFNEFSDHASLCFNLHVKSENDPHEKQNTPDCVKIIWDDNKSDLFNTKVRDSGEFLTDFLNNIDNVDIDTSVRDLTDFLQQNLKDVMGKEIHNTTKKGRSKQPWFDEECRTAKTNFNKYRNIFMKNRNDENKTNFLRNRTIYNKIKRKAQRKHKAEESEKI